MNIHKNARLTPLGRERMVRRVIEQGVRVPEIARDLGISQRTVRKWLTRFRDEGVAGLGDRGSRPHRHPRRTPERLESLVLRLRKRGWSAARIALRLGMPISTVGCVLRRCGDGRPAETEVAIPIVRYERERPGELVHLDTKLLGRIDGIGHRIHGDRRRRNRGIGWEHLHVCIDDHTRLSYCEIRSGLGADDATEFLQRAAAWFRSQGVPIERVMTDNGSGYVSRRFRAAVQALGARHIRTRPYTPRTNGKAERFIQTALREWAYARPYSSSAERKLTLDRFVQHYNTRRPHTALGRKPPLSRLCRAAA